MLPHDAVRTEVRASHIPHPATGYRASVKPHALYDSLVQTYRSRITLYFSRYLPRDDAEDLTQEVFIAAYRKLVHQHSTATETWLYRTAANRLIDHFRKVKRTPPAQTGPDVVEELPERWSSSGRTPGFEIAEDTLWLDQLFQTAAQVCSEKQLAVLQEYYRQDSLEAVAATLGMEYSTVRSHFQRGRFCLLTYLIQNASDLIGGRDTVQKTISRLKDTDSGEGFSERESLALSDPRRDPQAFRAACVKIARRLPDLLH